MRTCNACGQSKPLSEFYACKSGYRSACKLCYNAALNERRRNDEERFAKEAERRERNRETINANRRAWTRRNPEAAILQAAIQRSKRDGRVCTITLADIIIPSVCPLLGIPLFVGGGDNAPSIDRIDNNKDYIPGNVWVISTKANAIKGTRTIEEAFPHASKPQCDPAW